MSSGSSGVELHEGLTGVASSHMQIAATVGAAISANCVPASPAAGALDVVTCMISQVMTSFTPTFFTPTSTAVGYHSDGAGAVLQANAALHGTDISGGTTVAARDVFSRA